MIDILKPLIKRFMPFAQQKMGFSRPPKLFLRKDDQNAANPMGKTGFYDPEKESITIYISGRHPKDIMRSLAHELQHHTQKCNGDFESVQNMGEEGYAQSNPHMRTMEIQAYQASIVFRDWEDSCKGTIYYEQLQKGDNSSMSTKDWKNGEINTLLNEKWGFTFKVDALSGKKEILKEYATKKDDKEDDKGKKGKEEARSKFAKQKVNEDGYSDTIDHQSMYLACQQDCAKAYEKEDCIEKCMAHGGPMMAPLEEMCPAMEPEEGGIQGLAAKAIEAIQALADAAEGQGGDMMDDDMMGERRARGRKGPHIRGPEDPRLREVVRKVLKELSKGK